MQQNEENMHDTSKSFHDSFVIWKEQLLEIAWKQCSDHQWRAGAGRGYKEESTVNGNGCSRRWRRTKVLLQAVQQTISSEPRKNCGSNNVKVHGTVSDTADNYEKLNIDQKRTDDNIMQAVCSNKQINLFLSGKTEQEKAASSTYCTAA